MRLTTQQRGKHHVTIPDHRQLRAGTLAAIVADVTLHSGIERAELASRLFEQ